MSQNKLKTCIKPTSFRVLILPEEIPDEEVSPGGVVIARVDETKRQRQIANQRGTVIAIGPTAWRDYDKDYVPKWVRTIKDALSFFLKKDVNFDKKDWYKWAKVGDKVFYTKFGGKFVEDPETGVEYILLLDEDITAVISKEE